MKEIELGHGIVTQVDDADYERLSQFRWYCQTLPHTQYAYRVGRSKGYKSSIMMHIEILGADDELDVDHKDRNGLNNQRFNLRRATRSQNRANSGPVKNTSSQYKGVSWEEGRHKWFAGIKYNGLSIYIGRFASEEEAARAYDEWALSLFGEFARLNFPDQMAVNA